MVIKTPFSDLTFDIRNPVPVQTEEEIEMEDAYDYEGRHLTSNFRGD